MIKYKIKFVKPNVFVLVVPDHYERAMLFWRVQEFYESSCPRFRSQKFSFWDYAHWYAKKNEQCFSYPADFVGFNVPVIVAKRCYELNDLETPYDREMRAIVDSIFINGERQYIIGSEALKGDTFDHEMAHALYYTNKEYKHEMDTITKSLSKSDFSRLKKNLSKLGYYKSVFKDEIQAYMSTELSDRICRGVSNNKEIHKSYKKVFGRWA